MDSNHYVDGSGPVDARYLAFLETISTLRPSLHRYCARMTGSVKGTLFLQLRPLALALEAGSRRTGWRTGCDHSSTRCGHLDGVLSRPVRRGCATDRRHYRLHTLSV